MTIIQLILAFLNALPIIDKWFQQLTLIYIEQKRKANDEAFLAALTKSKTGSTSDLQRELGKLS